VVELVLQFPDVAPRKPTIFGAPNIITTPNAVVKATPMFTLPIKRPMPTDSNAAIAITFAVLPCTTVMIEQSCSPIGSPDDEPVDDVVFAAKAIS